MSTPRIALVCVFLLVSGCRTPALESIDQTVADLTFHPFDVAPVRAGKPDDARTPSDGAAPGAAAPGQDQPRPAPAAGTAPGPFDVAPKPDNARPPADGTEPGTATQSQHVPGSEARPDDVIAASYSQPEVPPPSRLGPPLQKFQLNIPAEVPGSETPLVTLPPKGPVRDEYLARLYAQLPPLPEGPVPLPGPDGRPYTLADFQRLATANSPALRAAASDVEAARGLLIQAGTYPNPMIGFESGPNNNNTATGTYAYFFDQVIKTGGKLTLQAAAAQMDFQNAQLALKRARSDLATQVRTAYYNLVVAQETVRVNKALARYTDEIFRLQADLLAAGFAASHEPAALRSQSYLIRVAYTQAITSYGIAWKQLVAAIGLPQLPLSAVEGEVDRLIPYYDYDAALAHVLSNHTDVITARNTLQKARYNLKFAQVTPVPDVELRADIWKETTILPKQNFLAATVSIPFPIWDKNRGNIRAASSALVRASEGPHQVELALTTGLAAAYAPYRNNLVAVEYYRRNILPDQVIYYRGVFERRKIDPNAAFADLVTAQQALAADVSAYLGVLGSLWTSVVTFADFLQTDDLYQLGKPLELPKLPEFEALHAWPCPHPQLASPSAGVPPCPTPDPHAETTNPPYATMSWTPDQWIAKPKETLAAYLSTRASNPVRSAGDPDQRLPAHDLLSGASTYVKALREHFAKFLGAAELPFGAPSPVADPPAVELPGPSEPDLSRRSGAASS